MQTGPLHVSFEDPPLLGFYLAGVACVFVLFTLVWLASIWKRDVSLIDIFWGPAFVVCGILFYWRSRELRLSGGWPLDPAAAIYLGLVALWGIRLALHIGARHRGEDYRYRAMREKAGPRFVWTSLLRVFYLQAGLVALICPPILYAIAGRRLDPELGWKDGLAIALFAVGFFFEAVGDWQLQRFKDDPANRGKVMRSGLWKYSRHPNYFGEAVIWVAFYFAAAGNAGGWKTLPSVVLMIFLLLRVSGVALLEKTIVKRRPEYQDYIETTPAFFPWFPEKSAGQAD